MVAASKAGGGVWDLVGSRRALPSSRGLEKPAASWPKQKSDQVEQPPHGPQAPERPRAPAAGLRLGLARAVKKLWPRP